MEPVSFPPSAPLKSLASSSTGIIALLKPGTAVVNKLMRKYFFVLMYLNAG
jgi:hypothetical protein